MPSDARALFCFSGQCPDRGDLGCSAREAGRDGRTTQLNSNLTNARRLFYTPRSRVRREAKMTLDWLYVRGGTACVPCAWPFFSTR